MHISTYLSLPGDSTDVAVISLSFPLKELLSMGEPIDGLFGFQCAGFFDTFRMCCRSIGLSIKIYFLLENSKNESRVPNLATVTRSTVPYLSSFITLRWP